MLGDHEARDIRRLNLPRSPEIGSGKVGLTIPWKQVVHSHGQSLLDRRSSTEVYGASVKNLDLGSSEAGVEADAGFGNWTFGLSRNRFDDVVGSGWARSGRLGQRSLRPLHISTWWSNLSGADYP